MRIVVVEEESRADGLSVLAARACTGASVTRERSNPDVMHAGAEDTDLLLLGPGLTDATRLASLVPALRTRHPRAALIVVSHRDDAGAAVAAMKAGATDYIVWRDDGAEVSAALAALSRGAARAPIPLRSPPDALASLVGDSPVMEQVRTLVRTAARSEAHVLIEGETGTGKEVAARAIHALGRRAVAPFIPINCAAIPEGLAESEFFGHARGAFTGAVQERPGALRLADRGTLFLDEIEDLSLALQAKLLRVVQDREVRPLGASVTRRVDVRLIAASNRDLWTMVEAGGFRRDLFYRLRVLAVRLPALRQRRDDIPDLVAHFLARFNQRHGTEFRAPEPAALRSLVEHAWPGNVRELENTLEAVLTMAQASGTALEDALRARTGAPGFWGDERTRIVRVLDEHRWNRQRAAQALGISRVTLWRWMDRHGIRDPLGTPARETA